MPVKAVAAERKKSPVQELSIGVVGAGDIARTAHLPVLTQCDGTSIAWIADVDAPRARSLGDAYKVSSLAIPKDLRDLPQADVILLSCPYGVRRPYYELLRSRECAIYVEKPFARTWTEHAEICAMFPDHALTSGLMMRCWSSNLMARQAIASGIFGTLRRVSYAHGRPGLVTGGRYYLDPAQGGGGMLSEFGIHGIDALLFVTQAVSATVDHVDSVREGHLDLHTDARLTLRLPDGGNTECRIVVTGMANVDEGIELEFDNAVVSYPLPGQGYALHGDAIDMSVTIHPLRGGAGYKLTPSFPDAYPGTKFQMFHDYWTRFLDGIRNRRADFTSALDARLTTEVIEEIQRRG